MNTGFFITGTDTGVGKTYVTALILAELRRRGVMAAAFKPIACGDSGRNDAKIYQRLMDNEVSLDDINPIWLRHPLAPSVAATLEKRRIGLGKVHSVFRHLSSVFRPVLVEGAGGLMVPIKRDYFVADLAREIGLPLVVIGRLGLGTINHCLLTVQQARARGLKVKGIVLNDTIGGRRGTVEKTNVKVVPELCGVPLLGVVRHGSRDARAICRNLRLL